MIAAISWGLINALLAGALAEAPHDDAASSTVLRDRAVVDDARSAPLLGIERLPTGEYRYIDPARQFTMIIGEDGRVRFADRWRRPSPKNADRGRCCGPAADGAVGLNPFVGIPHRGLAEALVRDPFQHHKRRALDHTRGFRTVIAIQWWQRQLKARLDDLPDELEQLWIDESELSDRKQRLFERWDECADPLPISPQELPDDATLVVDEARVDAAARARRQIEAFIRRKLPATSPQAYSEAELAQLNRVRRSVEMFAPYPSAVRGSVVKTDATE